MAWRTAKDQAWDFFTREEERKARHGRKDRRGAPGAARAPPPDVTQFRPPVDPVARGRFRWRARHFRGASAAAAARPPGHAVTAQRICIKRQSAIARAYAAGGSVTDRSDVTVTSCVRTTQKMRNR